MIRLRSVILALFILTAFIQCKKTKLKDNWSTLEGNWYWRRGWGDGGTKELKLVLKKGGTYKLFRNKDKIDHGRLHFMDDHMKFISDKLFNAGDPFLDTKAMVYISNDSINVTKTDCKDCAFSTFVKE